jgi:glycerate dehydrogenase/D-3-phosphoglycerate dehydrogenase
MDRICHIDKTIDLSAELKERLAGHGFSVEYLNLKEPVADPGRIRYLLLHGFLPDELLGAMTNCRYIGIRAHNTDYVNKQVAAAMGIIVRGLANQ